MNTRRFLKDFIRTTVFVAIICVQNNITNAQAIDLKVTSIDRSQFPRVILKVSISRDNIQVPNLSGATFTLLENNILQNIDQVDCSVDSLTRLSIALLIDRSASMSMKLNQNNVLVFDKDSVKIKSAKAAVKIFVSKLGVKDEAAIFSFSSIQINTKEFTVNQDFTKNIKSLNDCLDPILANGGTMLWKSIRETIRRTQLRSGRKFIIVLTDGTSSQGDDSKQSAINDAVTARIPIYTIGLGADVSVNELTDISNKTGGRFYKAPTAAQLDSIYLALARLIITDGCELRYTSSNPCLDGSTHNLNLMVHVNNLNAETDTFFVVKNDKSVFTVAAENKLQVTAGDSIEMPVYIREILSDQEKLHYDILLRFDPNLLTVKNVVLANTISDGASVTWTQPAPGQLQVSMQNFTPVHTSGILFRVIFMSNVIRKDSTALIEITNAILAQNCPTIVQTENGAIDIIPCVADYIFSSDSTIIGKTDEQVTIPLNLLPQPRLNENFVSSLYVVFDPTQLVYNGIDTKGTLSERVNTKATLESDNRIRIDVNGIIMDTSTVFVRLLFGIKHQLESSISNIAIGNPLIDTRCVTTVKSSPIAFLINGVCQQLVRLTNKKQYLIAHPNPFNPTTTLEFNVRQDADVKLDIFDSFGRNILTLLDQKLQSGEYRFPFNGTLLSSGTYFAILNVNGSTTIHRLLLIQ